MSWSWTQSQSQSQSWGDTPRWRACLNVDKFSRVLVRAPRAAALAEPTSAG